MTKEKLLVKMLEDPLWSHANLKWSIRLKFWLSPPTTSTTTYPSPPTPSSSINLQLSITGYKTSLSDVNYTLKSLLILNRTNKLQIGHWDGTRRDRHQWQCMELERENRLNLQGPTNPSQHIPTRPCASNSIHSDSNYANFEYLIKIISQWTLFVLTTSFAKGWCGAGLVIRCSVSQSCSVQHP